MEFTPAFFDEASAAWMMNKKRVGQMYVYRPRAPDVRVTAAAVPEKKVKHTYDLRSRSHNNAPVQ